MSIYHCRAKPISRAKGRSAVACAAYRSGDRLQDDYYGKIHDYTRKSGIVHSEVLLCQNAPREWTNRAALWNAVEKVEKNVKAQLAREYELALPKELSREVNIEIVRKYVQKVFVDKGMCADIAIHDPDKGNQNPHAHVMLTMRPILSDGRWGQKQSKNYFYDKNGQRQYDPVKKTYRCGTVKTTDWDDVEFLQNARAAWEIAVNEIIVPLGIEPIDHRSYKDQGKDLLPTVHLGTTAHRMEQKGIRTELGDINRRIRARNRRVLEIERQMKGLASERERLGRIIDIEHSEKAQQSPGYAHWAKLHNLKESAKAMSFLESKGISSYEQLVEVEGAARKHTQNIKHQLKALDEKLAFNGRLIRDKIQYNDTKAIYMAYADGGKKQAFRKAHSAEIEQYEAAVDRLREAEKQLGHKPPRMKELKAERVQLKEKRDTLDAAYQEARSESKDLTAARAAVESQLGIHRDIPQKQQEKRQEKQTHMPDQRHRKMDLRAELEQCTSEAERSPEAQSVRQDKPWGLSHGEPER
jgi:hypothetical protein